MVLELDLVDKRAVITKEGRKVGIVSGCLLDTLSWTVISLIVKVDKEMAQQLNVKTKFFGQTAITIKTNLVNNMSDVAQLNVDFATLRAHLNT